ncbi:sigma-70 family RNA polymerase sigma factor [Aequorivita sp. H23M31]|uniref:Sigma-70 family RNA polymerase sigma factor n=1 Tax=Aequorivita ciconiae TaxID=2494375 RepID=A0A410G5S7_9FLAO|nr:sigma-70 family RNA polymerase sigma factor [Aequorivita sp. H23M31]QAA82654.1 sigma-70 family RNA polymerase sigma factor [Aequorivita sp. H23M31]
MGDTIKQEHFALLDAFLTNKEIPMREFYKTEYPKIKCYILQHGGSLDNCKDIFQEAYLACWKKLSSRKFKPENRAQIEAYLFTIAKNKWIDQTRGVARKRTISMDAKNLNLAVDESNPLEMENKDRKLSITLSAFESLGPACKELLTQFYFYKLPLKIIAEKLELEENSAKNKKYRCIQKLREIALAKEKR